MNSTARLWLFAALRVSGSRITGRRFREIGENNVFPRANLPLSSVHQREAARAFSSCGFSAVSRLSAVIGPTSL
jgi:hypothetical protein